MQKRITSHRQLQVFQKAFDAAMVVFKATKRFPREEMYALSDQIRRSSGSVCSNLAEAWRKRRYEAAFISKLCDVEAEAAETQVWLEFAVKCKYIIRDEARRLYKTYNEILATVVGMIHHPKSWLIPKFQ
jgi:four helix bundle protein